MQNKEKLLEVFHVSKVFPVKKQQLRAVSDVSFSISRGEILGIVGESGCGKSTLAKILVGSLPASEGKMILNGECGAFQPILLECLQDIQDDILEKIHYK